MSAHPLLPAALYTPAGCWTAAALAEAAVQIARRLREQGVRVLATQLDNGAAWLLAETAAAHAGIVHVPLPAFFSAAQRSHALHAAGVDTLWLPAGAPTPPGLPCFDLHLPAGPGAPEAVEGRWLLGLAAGRSAPAVMPPGTGLVTFTSGTTGQPKGVCLARDRLAAVAAGLAQATAALPLQRHLAVLPLAVLLEQVAGTLAPAARGAELLLLPLAELGWSGSSRFDPARLQAVVQRHQAHSLILLPQMLRAWTAWLAAAGRRAPDSLRFVAVGGAAVGAATLAAARAVGLPVFEGYGLSEGGSVQTLNLPGADAPGSAGRPLPQARLRLAADGEVEVAGTGLLGYLGEAEARPADAWWPTGDLGRLDAAGHLWIAGRKKQLLITAYGRNVSPEWVECALQEAAPGGRPVIAQAVVLGDGQPALSAVLWPMPGAAEDEAALDRELAAAVAQANAGLPDYARIARWVRARESFDAASGMATDNGRPRRAAIAARHGTALGLDAPEPALPRPAAETAASIGTAA